MNEILNSKSISIEQVLEEYKDMVRSKAASYFILGAEKEDLIQEGMIGLVKAFNAFDGSKGASFKTFADRCVTRAMLDAIKSASRKKHAPLNEAVSLSEPVGEDEAVTLADTLLSDSESDPEAAAIYAELLRLLSENTDKYFSDSESEVVSLLLQGLENKQIAVALGKTSKQVDNAVQRIKNKLKEFLE